MLDGAPDHRRHRRRRRSRHGRIVIQDGRIVSVGPLAGTPAPEGAEQIDSVGRTIVPGLIDLHFHIEDDPKLALRQLSHGVTSFRDPGQWDDKFAAFARWSRTTG